MNNFSDKIQQLINKIGRKKFLFICSFIILFLIVIIIIISILFNNSFKKHPLTATFNHIYLIDYTTTKTISNQIKDDIEEVIFNEEELKTAPAKNSTNKIYGGYIFYDVTFDEGSFKTRRDLPEKSYQINFSVSDQRHFTSYYRLDENYGNNYFILILDRIDDKSINDYIIIHTNNQSDINNLESWAKETFTLQSPKTITKSLETPEGNQ
ncbi:MAG: hypothetical protein K6A29_01600 [Lachnospiraceae bacterium]|nr:hypothetical protein [Lachnospiraceae bacterium]